MRSDTGSAFETQRGGQIERHNRRPISPSAPSRVQATSAARAHVEPGCGRLRACGTESAARQCWSRWPRGGLSASHRHIVAASVACTSARWQLLEDILRAARSGRVRRSACEEALLQCYLFAGYPRAIEALSLLQRRWPRRYRARGIPGTVWQARGERLCRKVYGHHYERMRAHMAIAHPDLGCWMITEGYGKVLSRPALDPLSRELCALASLAALPAPRQLDAHVRGALRVGARPQQIRHAVALASLGCGVRTWRDSQRRAEKQLAGWSARRPS